MDTQRLGQSLCPQGISEIPNSSYWRLNLPQVLKAVCRAKVTAHFASCWYREGCVCCLSYVSEHIEQGGSFSTSPGLSDPGLPASEDWSHPSCPVSQVFGFFATIVFAIDFYLIFNDVAKFLKQGDSAEENTADKAEGRWPPCGFSPGTLASQPRTVAGDPVLL